MILRRSSRKRKQPLESSVPKRPQLSHSIQDLPPEMLLKIFSFLPRNEVLFQVSLVCQRWGNVIRNLIVWRTVILESSVQEEWLTIWLTNLPQLKHLVVKNRDDASAILKMVAQNCEHLESLKLFNCHGSISSKVMCNVAETCKQLRYISIEHTLFRSWMFLKCLGKNIKNNQIKGGYYDGPIKVRSLSTFLRKLVQHERDKTASSVSPDENMLKDVDKILNEIRHPYAEYYQSYHINFCIIGKLAGKY